MQFIFNQQEHQGLLGNASTFMVEKSKGGAPEHLLRISSKKNDFVSTYII